MRHYAHRLRTRWTTLFAVGVLSAVSAWGWQALVADLPIWVCAVVGTAVGLTFGAIAPDHWLCKGCRR